MRGRPIAFVADPLDLLRCSGMELADAQQALDEPAGPAIRAIALSAGRAMTWAGMVIPTAVVLGIGWLVFRHHERLVLDYV